MIHSCLTSDCEVVGFLASLRMLFALTTRPPIDSLRPARATSFHLWVPADIDHASTNSRISYPCAFYDPAHAS